MTLNDLGLISIGKNSKNTQKPRSRYKTGTVNCGGKPTRVVRRADSDVLHHRLVDALLESVQNHTAVLEHDAMNASVQFVFLVVGRHPRQLPFSSPPRFQPKAP